MLAAFEAGPLASLAAEWADVESFDTPGVGSRREEQPGGVPGAAAAAAERLDELGWDRCAVVCDSHAQAAGIELTLSEPGRVGAIFVSHAAARYSATGPRPALNPSVHEAAGRLLETDYRSFARAITQMSQGEMGDDFVERWYELVPRQAAARMLLGMAETEPELVRRLAGTQIPVVLGRHKGCVVWTEEGFQDAVEAVPAARTVVCDGIPARDPRFLAEVREISAGLRRRPSG
jgi:hypothetical protein